MSTLADLIIEEIVREFDYSLDFKRLSFRAQPELYCIGRGEQGVLLVEPYKSEILPHWRFRTPEVAQHSATKIYQLFLAYKSVEDFVGMDMARKFLQMGYTRARRYANHSSGKKYSQDGKPIIPREANQEKAIAAEIFRAQWKRVREDKDYLRMKEQHRRLYESRCADHNP